MRFLKCHTQCSKKPVVSMTTACISTLPFLFAHWTSQLLPFPKYLCCQCSLETRLHLLLLDSNICPGADLGANACTNYCWLLMLRTPHARPACCQLGHRCLHRSAQMWSLICVVTFLTSHIMEKHPSPLSLPPPLLLSVFFTPFFLHLWTQGSASGKPEVIFASWTLPYGRRDGNAIN